MAKQIDALLSAKIRKASGATATVTPIASPLRPS
jgi:hypothetical protein